jgi:hypothetical protein
MLAIYTFLLSKYQYGYSLEIECEIILRGVEILPLKSYVFNPLRIIPIKGEIYFV